jgi:hypothetical protein
LSVARRTQPEGAKAAHLLSVSEMWLGEVAGQGWVQIGELSMAFFCRPLLGSSVKYA